MQTSQRTSARVSEHAGWGKLEMPEIETEYEPPRVDWPKFHQFVCQFDISRSLLEAQRVTPLNKLASSSIKHQSKLHMEMFNESKYRSGQAREKIGPDTRRAAP